MNASVFLQESFPREALPHFPCPRCGASLVLAADSYRDGESALSRASFEAGAIDQPDREGVFSCLLECVDKSCRENVAMSGLSFFKVEHPHGHEEMIEYITPRALIPPLRIFALPKELPAPIETALVTSFSLFWLDPSAAANATRIAVERLMDHLGVTKTELTPKGRRRLTLHRRLEIFQTRDATLGKLLLAVKWLGNSGSHESTLERKDVLDGYALIEQVLGEVFLQRTKQIDGLAGRIIRAKGPVRIRPRKIIRGV